MVKKANLPRHIIDTAIKLAGEKGWQATTMADIAARGKFRWLKSAAYLPARHEILKGFTRQIDEAVLSVGPEGDESETQRDRLFDVMMRRFDALLPLIGVVWTVFLVICVAIPSRRRSMPALSGAPWHGCSRRPASHRMGSRACCGSKVWV